MKFCRGRFTIPLRGALHGRREASYGRVIAVLSPNGVATREMSNMVPVEQKSIDFYGETLIAVRDAQSVVWVPLRRLCEAIGVNLQGQLDRVERDPVLREEV